MGSQVNVLEVRWSLGYSWLLKSSIVTFLTLSNNVTPLRTNRRMTGCMRLLGSLMVNACIWSVGSAARNFGRLLMIMSLVKVWDVDGLVDDQVSIFPVCGWSYATTPLTVL
jgi:hypothetical protein